ncbi:MAG: FlgD immunoglobulin-like domain containing protein [Candidatus Eisenbacteria bacterium]|nr:FlgD immunoglobulin-like domain containing protein [Candidatus Eisenbacteria bacterium]
MSPVRKALTPLVVVALLSAFAGPGARGATADHPMILLHIGAPTGKNACGAGQVRCQEVVTAAPSDPTGAAGYFVYVLVRNADSTGVQTLAGLQFGIEYEGGPGVGIQVNDWRFCGSLEFPGSSWPASGSGNLMTWDPVNRCQTAELAVAGYFYVTPYSPATMRLVPRPVDGLAAVADCNASATDVYPRRLGWVSFGTAAHPGDIDGFNPCLEPPGGTEPIITFSHPRQGSSVEDDDVLIQWDVSDDVPHQGNIPQTWKVDDGPWQSLADRSPWQPVTTVNLERGAHIFRVRALDRSGQVGEGALFFTTTGERNLAPTLRLFGIPEPESPGPIGLDLSWVGADDRTPVDRIRYRYALEHRVGDWSGTIAASPDNWSDDLNLYFESLPQGSYRFHLSAIDDEGDESDPIDPVTFHVVHGPTGSPPSISLVDGPGFDEETMDPNPMWTAHGSDDSTGHEELTYSWRWDGGAWTPFDPSRTRAVSITSPGWHTMEARARDTDGLVSWHPELRRFRFVGVPSELAPAEAPIAIRMIAPNPSRGPTSLTFAMQQSGPVSIEVYDIQGRLVRRLLQGDRPEGPIRLLWDGQDDAGQPVASGTYLVRFRSENHEVSGRMVIAR